MNGEVVVSKTDALIFPASDAPKLGNKEQIFEKYEEKSVEKYEAENGSVSENETKFHGTRFARLKKSLRKRSASIL